MNELEMYEYWDAAMVKKEIEVFSGWLAGSEKRSLDLSKNPVSDWVLGERFSSPYGGGYVNPYVYSSAGKAVGKKRISQLIPRYKEGGPVYQDYVKDFKEYGKNYNEILADQKIFFAAQKLWEAAGPVGYTEYRAVAVPVRVVR
jgi:hypothetical protein